MIALSFFFYFFWKIFLEFLSRHRVPHLIIPACEILKIIEDIKFSNFRARVTYPTNVGLVGLIKHFEGFRTWRHFTCCRPSSVSCPIEPSTTVTSEDIFPHNDIFFTTQIGISRRRWHSAKRWLSDLRENGWEGGWKTIFFATRTENAIFIMKYFIRETRHRFQRVGKYTLQRFSLNAYGCVCDLKIRRISHTYKTYGL